MTTTIVKLEAITKAFDNETVIDNLSLDIRAGEFLTLLGPSGCGKTTLLRMISGFETPDSGAIYLNNQYINPIPAHERQVNTVFQSYALFPHMTLYDNVAFGLRCQDKTERLDEHVMNALRTVKLDHLAKRYPEQLSGGQQQRVAIARAAINKPLVLLLDEPLSALDYRLRQEMQIELKHLQRQLGITFVLVTHDQEEALSISDRIVVMQAGKIEQTGTPRDIYETPSNLSVAKFVGAANIFTTQVINTKDNNITVDIGGRHFTLKNTKHLSINDEVNVLIRPEDFSVWDRTEVDSEEKAHMIPAVVEDVIYKGSIVDLRLRTLSGEMILATEFFNEDDEDLNYRTGENVWAEFREGWEELLLS